MYSSAKVYLTVRGSVDCCSGGENEAKVSARRASNLSLRKGKQPSSFMGASVLVSDEAIGGVAWVGLVL